MKKLLISILALTLSVGGFAQNFCNDSIPKWGESLGTINFATDKTWTIGSQTWSDAVTATACDKTSFTYSRNNYFNADCRYSPGYLGKLFSWCAVIRFKDVLCPAPWRVPTRQDFVDLDIALGGTGRARQQGDTIIRDRYINDWGISFIGRDYSLGGNACYWSQSEHSTRTGFGLYFNPNNNYQGGSWNNPQASNGKGVGKALRCVRDN